MQPKDKARLLTGADYWNTAEADGVKKIRFSDGPTGVRAQSGKGDNLGLKDALPATCFPTLSALASSWSAELCREVGRRIGEEAANYGVDVILAPGLNIKRNPLCGRNFEYFSEDCYLSGKLGASWCTGAAEAGVGACVKHFAANNREYARMVSDSVVDERTLRELYLTSFEIAVTQGKPVAVMTAYNRLNGTYCNENADLFSVLRGEWGFDGIIVSDWGGTHDRVAAVKAGADLEMPNCKISSGEISAALDSGKISESDLDICIDRIISLGEREKKAVGCDFSEHADFAVKCAEQCITLLKNDGVLPLKKGVKAALFGALAADTPVQGGGSSNVNAVKHNLTDEIELPFFKGYRADGKPSRRLIKRAVKGAEDKDVLIVCLGGNECEGVDRTSLKLPENQLRLLEALKAAGKKIVAVLFGGSAYLTDWDGDISALVYANLLGQGAGKAVKNVLYGDCNPCGKLAETFPKNSLIPSSQFFGESPYYTRYAEGLNVGYRSSDDYSAYPFGFGLSYTSFAYSALEVESGGVKFTVTNTGERSGTEVAQLYINYPPRANAPKLQLKGFARVTLAAGESARVEIAFDEYSFRTFDVSLKKFVEVGGEYGVFVGGSSRSLPLKGAITRAGVIEVAPPDTAALTPGEYNLVRDKKGRVIAAPETPLCELKNCPHAMGRFIARLILRFARRNPVVYGTMEYIPLRTIAQFGKFSERRFKGFMQLFNGAFFKGIINIILG